MVAENREARWGDDQVFIEVLGSLKKGNYLGDLEVINEILRYVVSDLLDRLEPVEKPSLKMMEIQRQAKQLAHVLLGKSRSFQPMIKWNEAGSIDVFCRHWLGCDDATPEQRMEHACVLFFEEVLDVAVYASKDGVLPEQWGWQLDAIIEKYAGIFVGISPAQQAVLS